MILQSLKTKNFKKLGTREFAFGSGVNFIVGDNAKGKSTTLRAVSTALYGVASLPGVADDVATWGQSSWGVTLKLLHDGAPYEIRRTKSSASMYRDGQLVASGHTPVTDHVTQTFGVDLKDYNLLVHSRQGETGYVLKYGATALQRKVEELSGVDHVEAIMDLAKDKRKQSQVISSSMRNLLLPEEKIESLKADINRLEKELQKAKAEADELKTKVVDEVDAPDSDPQAARACLRAYREYLADMRGYESQMAEIQSQVDDLGPLGEPPEDTESLEATVKELKAEKVESEWAAYRRRAVKDELDGLSIRGDASSRELKDVLTKLSEDLEQAKEGRTALSLEIRQMQAQLEEGVCSACGTVLDEDMGDIEDRVDRSKDEVEKKTVLVEELQVQVERQKQLVSESVRRSALEKELSTLEGRSWEKEEELEQAVKSLHTLEGGRSTYERKAHTLRRLQERLGKLSPPKVVDAVSEEECEAVENEWKDYERKKARAGAEKERLEHSKEVTRMKIQQASVMLDGCRRQVQAEETHQLRIGEAEETEDLCKQMEDYLKQRRSDFLDQVWDNITVKASEFLDQATNSWMTGVAVKDGRFFYEEAGSWAPVSEASGAQTSFLGVALRVGLGAGLGVSRELSIYDEPTASMTEENARNLVASLAQGSGQVIVVSHRETDQGLAETLIHL